MVYDVNNRSTFEKIKTFWLKEFRKNCQAKKIALVLVGNQIDKCQQDKSLREVSISEAKEFADKEGMKFIETSAKENVNVVKTFELLLKSMQEINMPQEVQEVRRRAEADLYKRKQEEDNYDEDLLQRASCD